MLIDKEFREVVLRMKVLLIDDHDLFRDGIQLVLANLEADMNILSADSYENALPLMEENQDIALILLDLGLPGLSDIDALKATREQLPSAPVVVISGNHDGAKVQEILNLGAQGYIPKSTSASVMLRSIKLVLSGGIYIPPEILSQLEQKVDNGHTSDKTSSTGASLKRRAGDRPVNAPLTPRQTEVLKQLIHGYSNKEISKLLNMAESTVRVHIAAILKELNVSNRTRAVNVALQKGWATVEQK